MAHDVFISYSSRDKSFADAICHGLEAENIRCWIAPRDLIGTWADAISEAIDGARVLVVVFSENTNQSKYVIREVERAVTKGIAILPVRVQDALPSKGMGFFLSSEHWLDAFPPPTSQYTKQLAIKVGVLMGEEGSRRAAPQPPAPPPREVKDRQLDDWGAKPNSIWARIRKSFED